MPALKFQDFKDAMDQCLSEALSTCLIVFFSGLIRMTSPDSFIAGGVVFFLYSFLIYGNYKFSKSHFNPAVTIAYYLHDDLSMLSAIMLVICQLVGSVGAALLLALMELLGVNKQKHMFLGCPWLGTFTYNGKLIQSTTMFQREFYQDSKRKKPFEASKLGSFLCLIARKVLKLAFFLFLINF